MTRFYRLAGLVAAIGCGAYFIAVGVEHAKQRELKTGAAGTARDEALNPM